MSLTLRREWAVVFEKNRAISISCIVVRNGGVWDLW